MGTKNDPGKYDCYIKARADEPMFVLLARDPVAPLLVQIWAMIRAGNRQEARVAFEELINSKAVAARVLNPDSDKALEATDVALEMLRWREMNE